VSSGGAGSVLDSLIGGGGVRTMSQTIACGDCKGRGYKLR
jgi:hypothetical protein